MPLVVIDPGHGGRDPGAVANGYQEKNLVLPTSLFLRDALRRSGFDVIMSRETDVLPLANGTIGQDLSYRADIANRAGADLFVSWHADSATSAGVNGVAVWIHPSTRGTRTNLWAQRIVNGIAGATGQANRGVYLGDFAVLRETNMDAVLVEAGFITNPNEAGQLNTTSFQRAQAEGAARAICEIFGVAYQPPAGAGGGTPPPNPGTGTGTTPPTPTVPTPPTLPTTPTAPAENTPIWAQEPIRQVQEWGIMVGDPSGRFRPNDPTTRAELAAVIARLVNFLRNGGV